MNKSYLNMIGLAFRAGKCTVGEESIVKDIKRQNIKLLIIANDASENTHKKLTDKSKHYNVPYVIGDNREVLSQAIGKVGRVAIGITDSGFAKKIASLLDQTNRG
ncbi:ribosomal protein L7Ae-like RNA K-turn-binding protein [Salirhabdus euzebyi]|uniref:Ribosomal protein L7Ae-like RNA K-turn-binding protein n=1 Tax=Salirhabdus euzebyi TaxID=394506 RepID=A0A841Q3C9_9BACI|nr:ribosomal L7Ae/L30e/S12e/Gadd45 family protein [Salirhabdus euzebyi]MBB6452882.1 ribosomal protein L7Ae-like RNA K-turn-binding protein [Salirhabdus euzebyi]